MTEQPADVAPTRARWLQKLDQLVPGYLSYRGRLPWPWYPLLRWFSWRWFWGQEAERARKARIEGGKENPLWRSERAVLTETVVDLAPFERLLEVGCGYGQSLHILAPLLPETAFVGIDRNAERVREGMALFEERQLGNVQLIEGAAERLGELSEKSFDVVMTAACLLYIAPTRIEDVLRQLTRIAARAVVLLELHDRDVECEDPRLGLYVGPGPNDISGFYVRDYRALLQSIVPDATITVHRIHNPLWSTEQWQSCGAVITALLKPKETA